MGLWHGSCSLNPEGAMVFEQCRRCRSGEETDAEERLPAPNIYCRAWGLLPSHVPTREVLGSLAV